MLRRGGNAMDAAIASTLVVGVTEGNTSLAGGGALTYYEAKTKKTIVINFEPNGFKEDVLPYTQERDSLTGRSTKVSGSFAGFYLASQKYGVLPWRQLLEPAIFYAENGYPINGHAYSTMRQYYATLTLQPSGRQIFAPDGFLPKVGELFKQPELAETLKKISEQGPDYFYKGPFAEKMVKAIQEIGGKATLEDFASYRALELDPVKGSYKDYQIIGPPAPGDSTIAFIEAMNILENVDLKSMGHYSQSADSLQWMIEVLRVMYNDVRNFSGVPEFDRALGQVLMSKEYARRRYELIQYKIEQMKRLASEKTSGAQTASVRDDYEPGPDRGTHHVSSVDRGGNVCSFMHTIYGSTYSYSGLFVGGLVLNASGGFRSHPGERIYPQCGPPIVFKGDRPYFAPGSSGGTVIPFFLIANILIWGENFKEAQEAPRFGAPAPGDNKVRIEHRIDDKVIEELKRRGYQIEWLAPYSMASGQVAGIDPTTGIRFGATDPRAHGKAAGQ